MASVLIAISLLLLVGLGVVALFMSGRDTGSSSDDDMSSDG
jgi:hypothetical protein